MCFKELKLGRDRLSRKQTLLLNRTLKHALSSECHQQHGAMLVKSGRIISLSVNKNYNNADMFCNNLFNKYRDKISIHAEIAAIKGVSEDVVKGSTIYVARVLKNGGPGLSKPCKSCEKTLNEMGVKKVIYS